MIVHRAEAKTCVQKPWVARFSEVFTQKLKEWKCAKRKEYGRRITDEDFAKAIEKASGKKCARTSISEWRRGGRYPEQYLPAICEVLGAQKSDFYHKEVTYCKDCKNYAGSGMYCGWNMIARPDGFCHHANENPVYSDD